jgi:hypothetical protein
MIIKNFRRVPLWFMLVFLFFGITSMLYAQDEYETLEEYSYDEYPLADSEPDPLLLPEQLPFRENSLRFNTLGASLGTSFTDMLIIATVHGTFSPMRNIFIELGFRILLAVQRKSRLFRGRRRRL